MSPRLSSTTNVSPDLSARGGRPGWLAVMVNAASAGAAVGNAGPAGFAAVLATIFTAGLAEDLGDIAVRLATRYGVAACGRLLVLRRRG